LPKALLVSSCMIAVIWELVYRPAPACQHSAGNSAVRKSGQVLGHGRASRTTSMPAQGRSA
jgi:hypothetical protein